MHPRAYEWIRYALLCVLTTLLGCQTDAVGLPAPDMQPPPLVIDGGPLPDSELVFVDAAAEVPDAAILDDAGNVCRTGGLAGVVCAPGNTSPIIGADVAAIGEDCRGNRFVAEARSDSEGRFTLTGLAPGPVELTIHAGRFVVRLQSEVVGGVISPASGQVSPKICVEADSARIAVLTGDYDSIESILSTLGFTHDVYCGQRGGHRDARRLLLDRAALAQYDILFVNCATGIDLRSTNPQTQQIIENLRAFVEAGNSIYVSDLAADFINQAWPEAVLFEMTARSPRAESVCCVCTDCEDECLTEPTGQGCVAGSDLLPQCRSGSGVIGRGEAGIHQAAVTGDFLARFLGSDTLAVDFNLGGWVPVTGVADSVEVLVEDETGPLMVLFQPSPTSGRVAYTAFHNHAQAAEPIRRILEALIFRL